MNLRTSWILIAASAVMSLALCSPVSAFSEQTLPPKDAPASPAVAPGAVASPAVPSASGGPNADWQQVPTDTAAGTAPDTGSIPPATEAPAPISGGITPASATIPPDNSPPPALDVSTITGGLDPSQAPLTGEIKHADNPALAASLHQTEQARKELADGKLDEALRSLSPAVSIDPSNPFAYFYLGRVYMERKNFAQALTFFKRADINFGTNPAWFGATLSNEGICYEEMNQMSNAAAAYRRALAAAPNNLIARAGLGRLGEEFPDTTTAANPATPPEAIGSSANSSDVAPAPEEAPPPPPPDVPPGEDAPADAKTDAAAP
jgi:hypothetical protein